MDSDRVAAAALALERGDELEHLAHPRVRRVEVRHARRGAEARRRGGARRAGRVVRDDAAAERSFEPGQTQERRGAEQQVAAGLLVHLEEVFCVQQEVLHADIGGCDCAVGQTQRGVGVAAQGGNRNPG